MENLLKLIRFVKLIYEQFKLGTSDNNVNKNKVDILELFRVYTEIESCWWGFVVNGNGRIEKEFKANQQKLKYIEELYDTKLFKKYLKASYQIKHIFLYLISLFINHFSLVCYFL